MPARPVLTEEQSDRLRQLQRDSLQEVVGHFVSCSGEGDALGVQLEQVARGDDDKVAFRDHHPLIWHTHPTPTVGSTEPPSAPDLMQILSWGYPDYNPQKWTHAWGLVVASDGFWWYRATKALKTLFFEMQDRDEELQNLFAKRTQRYCAAVLTLFKNELVPYETLVHRLRTIDFGWLTGVLQRRPDLVAYLHDEFPLESMHKLMHPVPEELPATAPGFVILRV